jgi:hypothetical protein
VTAHRRGARDDLLIRLPEEPKGERIPIQSTPDTPDYVDPGPDGPLEKVLPAELERHSRDGDAPDHEHPAGDEPLPDAERFDASEALADQVYADALSRQDQPLPDPPADDAPLPDAERFDASDGLADQVDADADSRQDQPLPDPPAYESIPDAGFEPADGYSG